MEKDINIIKVEFGRKNNLTVSNRYQHDKGQIIKFLDIPDGAQVEFANENHERAEPYMVKNSQVEIPDFLLEENSPIVAYVKVVDENSETTIKTITIPVTSRPESDDGVPPENQQTFKQQIQEIVDSTKQIAQSIRDDADSGVFKGDKGDTGDTGPIGPKGEKGEQGEPGKDGKDYVLTDEDKESITECLISEKEWQLFRTYEADGETGGFEYTAASGIKAKELKVVGYGLTFSAASNINLGFRTSANPYSSGHKQLVFGNGVVKDATYQLEGLIKRIGEEKILVSMELWAERSVATTNVLKRQHIFTDKEIIEGKNIVYLCSTVSLGNKINSGTIETYVRGVF